MEPRLKSSFVELLHAEVATNGAEPAGRTHDENFTTRNNANSGTLRSILEAIGILYVVEAEARERELKVREIRKLRQRESAPIPKELKRFLDEIAPAIRPQSEKGKAISYALNQWERLRGFLIDGNMPIDNNGVENKIRPFVIGRKNWLFAGSPKGAHHAGSTEPAGRCNLHLDPKREGERDRAVSVSALLV